MGRLRPKRGCKEAMDAIEKEFGSRPHVSMTGGGHYRLTLGDVSVVIASSPRTCHSAHYAVQKIRKAMKEKTDGL